MTSTSRRRKWLNRTRTFLVYVVIFMLAGFLGNLWMSRDQAAGQAPSIRAQDLNGQWLDISTADFKKPVLLYFFAEWCPICKVQHSVISALSEQYPVIGIAMQSGDSNNVKSYVRQQGLDFLVLNDHDGAISREFGVQGVPASFIIDQQGDISFSTRGYATYAGLWARLWLSEQG